MVAARFGLTVSEIFETHGEEKFRDAVKASESILVKVLAVMGHRLRSDLEAVREREAKAKKR